MIILDTNVISEAMRGPLANEHVIAWILAAGGRSVTTVINRAELLAGIALLPDGGRKSDLRSRVVVALDQLGACLPLTTECADHYADIVAHRSRAGRPVGSMDALIAAIARVSGAAIATRDVDGFADLGVDIVNPWDD